MTQKYIVRLSTEERAVIFQLPKEGKASKEKQNRAPILLKADCGKEGDILFCKVYPRAHCPFKKTN
ncbi:MAG: hypothetical protein WCG14_07095 [Chlamydiia bacterium]|jgi:hypothetical protein